MSPLAAIRGGEGFGWLVLASLLVHAVLLALAVGFEAPGSGPRVDVYTVQIIEAPIAPPARQLELAAPSAPELTLSETPPVAPRAPSLSSAAKPPPPLAPPALAPELDARATARPPAALAPGAAAQDVPDTLQLSAPPALPRLPATAKARPKAAPDAPAVQTSRSLGDAGADAAAEAPAPPTALEQLREKVQRLNLQVEATPSRPAATEEARDRSLISLRLYQNTVRERVQEAYTFPGSFPARLQARVRVIVDREGRQRSVELISSSGNQRFDRLVCLAAVRKAKLPAIPDAVEGDTLALNLICTP